MAWLARVTVARRLLVLAVVEASALGVLAWWPGPAMPVPGIPLFMGAFAAYALAAFLTDHPAARTPPGPRTPSGSVPVLTAVWVGAVLLRLVLLPAAPELSDDVFRYLWDGHVQLQGVNPYRYAPADPALAEIRTSWHDRINHPEISTIYPPVAQMAFLVIALLGGGILQAKLLWVGLDLTAGWILSRVARKTGRPPVRVLVLYLWSPLLVVETAWSAHLEPLGLVALAALVALAGGTVGPERARPDELGKGGDGPESRTDPLPGRSGLAAAAAALTKFAPAAALPPLLRRLGLRFGVAFVAASVVAYLPYLDAGTGLWEGLFTYVRDWRFMVGPFSILESALPGRWPPRLAAAAIVSGTVAWTTWRRFSAERSLFWILGAGLLLSPTVHPWYVLWILPFAALRGSGPWILLSGLVFLGYWGLGAFQDTGAWPQPVWLRLLVWIPPLAWLAIRGLGAAVADHAREPLEGEGQVTRPEED